MFASFKFYFVVLWSVWSQFVGAPCENSVKYEYIYILVPKTIEIVWVSGAHTASYNFISLTPLFFKKIKGSLKIRVKWVIWILIAARSWQWAVVARNRHNYTPSLTSYWVSNVEMWKFTIRTEPWVHAYMNREFILIQVWIHAYKKLDLTLIQSVNLRLYKAWIHVYANCGFTHIRSVNLRLNEAWIHVYSMHEFTLARSVKSCQRIQRILRF